VVIVSCCRTTDLGFLASRRRLNVTMTRARHHLVILGSAPALLTDGAWSALLEEAQPLPSTFYSDRPASHALTALGASQGGPSEVREAGRTATGTPVGREVDLLALEDSDDDDEGRGGDAEEASGAGRAAGAAGAECEWDAEADAGLSHLLEWDL
jgi:hypothetical protein